MKIPEEKQYEYLTHHLEYLNEKIIECFKLFIKLATAIFGGVFFLSWKLEQNDPKRADFALASKGLFVFIAIAAIILIGINLFAWIKYRRTLSEQYPNIKRSVCPWAAELIMIMAIVGICIFFWCCNPLSRI